MTAALVTDRPARCCSIPPTMSPWRSAISMSGIDDTARREDRPSACPSGHKFSTRPMKAGEPVVKFGQIIGFAKHRHVRRATGCMSTIAHRRGTWRLRARLRLSAQGVVPTDFVPEAEARDLRGFQARQWQGRDAQLCGHPDLGELLGHRRRLHRHARSSDRGILRRLSQYRRHHGAEAVQWLRHRLSRRDLQHAEATTWGYATNPNMGGVIMVGLGCEGFQIPRFKEAYDVTENETFRTMTIQERAAQRRPSRPASRRSGPCCRSSTTRSARRCRRRS